MTLSEARTLPKGTLVEWSQGNGWYQEATFIGLNETTSFGRHTFEDLMTGNIDFSKGKKSLQAHISFVDDRGRTQDKYVNPRAIRRI